MHPFFLCFSLSGSNQAFSPGCFYTALSFTPCDTSNYGNCPTSRRSQAGMIEQCVPARCGCLWDSCSLPGNETGRGGGEPPLAASSSPARDLGFCLLVMVAREGEVRLDKGQRCEMGKPKLCSSSRFWGPKPRDRNGMARYLNRLCHEASCLDFSNI